MTKEELKQYIKDRVKDLECERQKEYNGDDEDYREGRFDGTIFTYLDILDMIDQLKEG